MKPAPIFQKWCRFCFMLLVVSIKLSAQQGVSLPKDYQESQNLNDQWLVYEQGDKGLTPYFIEKHKLFQSKSLILNVAETKYYTLSVNCPKGTYLFVNSKYQGGLKPGWNHLKITNFSKQANADGNLLLSLYQADANLANTMAYLTHNKPITLSLSSNKTSIFPVKPRNFGYFGNFLILISIFLLSAVGFMYNFQDDILQRYTSLRDLFTFKNRIEGSVNQGPIIITNILFLILLSLFISLTILSAENNFGNIIPEFLNLNSNENFAGLSLQFFNLGFLVFVALILKYFLISAVGNLYKLNKISNLHYFKILQALAIFTLALFTFQLLNSFSPFFQLKLSTKNFLTLIAIFFMARTILLFFVLNRVIIAKNLYLFSYLCIVEIIPVFLGLRLVL